MLRVALPNKGVLSEPAAAMLREAGYRQRSDSKELVTLDPDNGIEFYYLRPKDIAVYVGEGTLDLGITGRDMLLDSGSPADEILSLGFGKSTFWLAAKPGTATSLSEIANLRVATSYAGLVGKYLAEQGISAQVIRLDGAVETAIRLGVADVIADVVETGATLRQAGLELFGEPLLESEAVLVRRSTAAPVEGLDLMMRRLQGVLVARNYVLMDYDLPEDKVDDAAKINSGLEGLTVSPLHRANWVAVRVMVPRREAQRLMDDLWEIGARAILVTDIHACRL
ncbi:ATP phosphoribosyltransferase [Tenggerimyces flavus]|uniref:ATP phosphoribosyltransferase n=1 Tax=Tenggerimyces flavus TaxID=1708749 RepID=A0ABV7YJC1_9ACTN|nr:ATP phosphoribosyltransferase [Tenggerimyces flavus]MBM7787401.1 ATP phosphoribosyltransferase [Tenggerimyces flavus]